MKKQINNIDKHIASKLKDRELKPSSSAWERLNVQLDNEQHKKKKKGMLYLGYVASVAILISLGVFYQVTNSSENAIDTIIVETSLDTVKIKKINLEDILSTEEAIVKTLHVKNKNNHKTAKNSDFKNYKESKKEKIASLINEPVKITETIKIEVLKIANENTSLLNINTQKKQVLISRVKVNSDDLLFAVTHSPQEVKEYYAKYKVKREKVLETIKKELMRSNLKINPETILAEVEYDLEEADFKKNFMRKFKLKLSDVIVAIADRNK
ncbi:hypothetical protein CXF68_10380 [Tenacibaculum sp. Bg11-29]|uniref:hypothetical protein n=1 Tax=Tenacibaculum sp. Bg11-29 TaxID=2058306 RepID=UPI000C34CDC3|nr:hypothetical protein [Tenacibaculum sp. Bg11-29]PKH51065.1 hypothetical protein CXF68_10380 [Tenacibaculum sp. Bg11-29]